jgi:hypothetical protein
MDTTVTVVNEDPGASLSPADTTVAPGATVTLTASPAGAAYQWSTGATTRAITVQAPAIANPSHTYSVTVKVNGCTGTAAATVSSFPVTLCTQCGWDGDNSAWVDCYVTTNAYPFERNTINTAVQWSGNGQTFYPGASGPGSDKNGRANTAAITSSTATVNAVQLCKNLGAGWYLPAYEELINMGLGIARSPLNNRTGAGILGGLFNWSSTELYENGGRISSNSENAQYMAVDIYSDSDWTFANKEAVVCDIRCVWRP